jgi:hypothetical protein
MASCMRRTSGWPNLTLRGAFFEAYTVSFRTLISFGLILGTALTRSPTFSIQVFKGGKWVEGK